METPRNMGEWVRAMERRAKANAVGGVTLVQQVAGEIGDGIAADKVRHPTAPIELVYDTALYTDPVSSRRWGRLSLDFPDVTLASDGTALDIRGYELWGRDETLDALSATTSSVPGLAAPGLTLPGLAATPAGKAMQAKLEPVWHLLHVSDESTFHQDGFIPGSVWRFRARAMGTITTTPGDWSIEFVVQMAPDTTPPPQPTAPILTVARGTITVQWDGQAVTGTMPSDFRYLDVAQGTAPAPEAVLTRFFRGGGFTAISTPYYESHFFRFRAVDESGNYGPWSAESVAYTTPLVDTDLILSTIDGAVTALKNIDASVSVLANTVLARHIVASEDLTAKVGQFLKVNAGQIDANDIWADHLWVGLADAVLVRADMFIGKQFSGGTFTGSKFQTDPAAFKGVTLDPGGIHAYDVNGSRTFNVDSTTGYVETVGRFYTSVAGQPGIAIVPPSASWNGQDMGVFFAHDSHSLPGGVTAAIWLADPTAATNLNVRGAQNAGVTVWNGLRLDGNTSEIYAAGQATVSADYNVVLNPGAGKFVHLTNAGSPYNMTSSSSANVYLHTDGNLFKSTSSMKYKDDVQDWDTGMKALNLRPRSWVAKEPMEGSDPAERFVGFVAEEVLEYIPEFVVYDADGNVDALAYDRIVASIIPVLKNLNDRLTTAGL